MKNIFISRRNLCFYFLLIAFFISVLPCLNVYCEGKITILKPETGKNPRNFTFFHDENLGLNLFFQYVHDNSPDRICYVTGNDTIWSAPINLSLEGWNNACLGDIKVLENGTPMMVLVGDDTDYSKIFDLSQVSQNADMDEVFEKLGLDQDRLFEMANGNMRLFSSFLINGEWQEPVPIPGTYGASKPVLAAGGDNSAIVVYYVDADKNIETVNDVDLYANIYHRGTWQNPVRLTENDKLEYNAQAVYVNDRYLIVWGSDEDSDLSTTDDKLLRHSIVGYDGSIIVDNESVINDYQDNAFPILGLFNDRAALLWSSETVSAVDARRPVWQCEYYHGWGLKQKTNLLNVMQGSGSLTQVEDKLVFIYQETGVLQAAVNEGDGWYSNGQIMNLNTLDIDSMDAACFTDENGTLHVGLIGFVPGIDRDYDNEYDGIYYLQRSLLTDLAVKNLFVTPRKKMIGSEIKIEFDVKNEGYFKSNVYSVQVIKNNEVIDTLNGEGLHSGSSQTYAYKTIIDKPALNFGLKVISDSNESNPDNNIADFPVQLEPDYKVRSVQYQNNIITARIIENKGIAAPPVSVDFYLNRDSEDDVSELIGSSTYDPVEDSPVELSWLDSTVTGPFQITVEVNNTRVVEEDDYSNNKNSYIFNPLPDFVITSFLTANENIHVNIENIGNKDADTVDLLITDDPEIAVSDEDSSQSGEIHYYQEIDLDQSQVRNLKIQYADLAEHLNKKLYAIVNPYNNTTESNLNNNLQTALISISETLPEQPKILFGKVRGYGSTISAALVNMGNNPAIGSKLCLLNEKGLLVSQKAVPVIAPRSWKEIVFRDVKQGKYTVRLIIRAKGYKDKILEKIVEL